MAINPGPPLPVNPDPTKGNMLRPDQVTTWATINWIYAFHGQPAPDPATYIHLMTNQINAWADEIRPLNLASRP